MASSRQTRPWTVDDLYDKRARLRAIPVLVIDKWDREREGPNAAIVTTSEIKDALVKHGLIKPSYSDQGAGNLIGGFIQREHRRRLHPSLFEPLDKGAWRVNIEDYEAVLRDFRNLYPIPSPGLASAGPPPERKESHRQEGEDTDSQLRQILELIDRYGRSWAQRLAEAERRADAAAEVGTKRQGTSILDDVTDDQLRIRLGPLFEGKAKLDAVIREASVVLEDRLRSLAGAESDLHGVELVDAVFNPKHPILAFSRRPAEQEGVRFLYRGAMQFIRNPPMHRLMDYPESAARQSMRMMDALLQLLKEGTLKSQP